MDDHQQGEACLAPTDGTFCSRSCPVLALKFAPMGTCTYEHFSTPTLNAYMGRRFCDVMRRGDIIGYEQAVGRCWQMATERGPVEERFCPSCGGGNPPVALHCMWCGRSLAAEAAAAGRGESTGYTAPLRYSLTNPLEVRSLSRGQYRVLRAVGLGLIVIGALVS